MAATTAKNLLTDPVPVAVRFDGAAAATAPRLGETHQPSAT
jgi:hypothetical protein